MHPHHRDEPALHAHAERRHGRDDPRERRPHRRRAAAHVAAGRSRRGDGGLARRGQRRGHELAPGPRLRLSRPERSRRRGVIDPIGFCFPHYFVLPQYSSASSYRFRPLGPEETLFEIWSLTRYPDDRSPGKPTPPEPLAPDDPSWPTIPAQDFSNLPQQQKGLHAKGFEYMRLSDADRGADLELRARHRRLPRRAAVRAAGAGDPEDEYDHRRTRRRSRAVRTTGSQHR